jgi:quercetin dioxygenase-like cupin family protein
MYKRNMRTVAKSLDHADKSLTFLDGSTRVSVLLGTVVIGRGTYLPGWRWSLHVSRRTRKHSTGHVGYVLAGKLTISTPEGNEVTVAPGEAFEIGPRDDAWVVGNETCIALDFQELD